jgi:alkanesulfonate monooxygenase SsuD/methylene tetrahydromethanopterin reductase-like flavin-dependent oxidoreductase (luciferase family)
LPTLERQLALFHAARREAGRPPATEIPLKRECYVAPDTRSALAEVAPFLDQKYAAYRQWGQDRTLPPDETFSLGIEALTRDRFVVGDPVHVTEQIARYRERLGATMVIFRLQWPGMEPAKVLRSIRLLGERVLPRFRGA